MCIHLIWICVWIPGIFLVLFMLWFGQAYNYHGETLLAQDKCGDAIKCLEESQSRNQF